MKPLAVTLRALALVLLAAATLAAIHRWTLQPFRCARAAVQGGAALDRAQSRADSVKLRVAREVRAGLGPCECVSPTDVRVFYTLARASATLGDHRGAIAGYRRALAIDRRPEIYFALGMAYLETHDRSAAVENFARAAAFDPARLEDIPFGEVREETKARMRGNV
jgi:tetratricopeptide (TPR) repeat protein